MDPILAHWAHVLRHAEEFGYPQMPNNSANNHFHSRLIDGHTYFHPYGVLAHILGVGDGGRHASANPVGPAGIYPKMGYRGLPVATVGRDLQPLDHCLYIDAPRDLSVPTDHRPLYRRGIGWLTRESPLTFEQVADVFDYFGVLVDSVNTPIDNPITLPGLTWASTGTVSMALPNQVWAS